MRLIMTLTMFFLGCLGLHAERRRGAEFCLEVGKLNSQIASRLKQKRGIESCAFGENSGQGIQSIDSRYMLARIVKINEAREILLDAVQEYEKAINDNISIRPYLLEYPFDIKRLYLSIIFQPMPMSIYGTEFVSHAFLCDGNFCYSADNDLEKPQRYKNIKRESYEEALKIRSGDHHD